MRSYAGILTIAAPCAILAVILALALAFDADDAQPARAAGDPVLVGAGDIADCGGRGDEATARVLDGIGGTVFTLGDNAYESGTNAEFRNCYAPSWGHHKARTRPAPGNHDYNTPGAGGYFGYFGKAAGDPGSGYYSYDRGAWHVIVLNSNCGEVRCTVGSRQERWLRADLAANERTCTLALSHHPRFSSGMHGDQTSVLPLWEALYEAGADVVLPAVTGRWPRPPQDALQARGGPDGAACRAPRGSPRAPLPRTRRRGVRGLSRGRSLAPPRARR